MNNGLPSFKAIFDPLVKKFEAKRSLLRPRHRWEDNIKMDIKAINSMNVWIGFNWLTEYNIK
jgi:hypothetical protein